MKATKRARLSGILILLLLAACSPVPRQQEQGAEADWKEVLTEQMPLLGHRNWIVVTDMAYPLQTNPGITTLLASEPYDEVIRTVDSLIKNAPHVFAHIYQDREQQALSEELAPGWDDYKARMNEVLDLGDVQFVPHEELIKRLDSVSNLCKVVIMKTTLTIPYTSTFFELDCNYWDAERETLICE